MMLITSSTLATRKAHPNFPFPCASHQLSTRCHTTGTPVKRIFPHSRAVNRQDLGVFSCSAKADQSSENLSEAFSDNAQFDFRATSIDIYASMDPKYCDQPKSYRRKSSPCGQLATMSYVGTDEEEKLPEDYKYAEYKGEKKKEIILLQGFDWDSWKVDGGWYNKLMTYVDDIAEAGVTHVWLPPPSQSVSAEGYMPTVLYNMDSKYGSHKELKELLRRFNAAGVVPLADIVINHRCAQEQDDDGVWNKFDDEYQKKYGLGGYGADHLRGIDWDKWAITSDDPKFNGTGNPDSGADFEGAPDLDHHNPELRAALKDWLNWLHRDIGFCGWRLDFVKGYAPEYMKEYIEETIGSDSFHVAVRRRRPEPPPLSPLRAPLL
mmetsp:Transcript_16212/g.38421  ORF Transcript_16212/g.38421 Transcript_16212/m.38421 type:complete len:378 (-) Transcript_16212:11-1144(-)